MTQAIRCIIIDDEQIGIDILRDHIEKIPELQIVSTYTDPVKAVANLEKEAPELIFLDIDMPGFTGLDFVEILKSKYGNKLPFRIIFTTAHDKFAITGFEQGVADYLLKPISFKRFKMAIDRLFENFVVKHGPKMESSFFFVETEGRKVKIDFADIIYLESAGNYTKLITVKGKYTLYSSLASLYAQLPKDNFSRIHNSFVVAIAQIQSVTRTEVVVGVGKEMKNLPIGVTFKEPLFNKLKL